jgi:hypothetical protein
LYRSVVTLMYSVVPPSQAPHALRKVMVPVQNDESTRPTRQSRFHLSIVTSLTLRVFRIESAILLNGFRLFQQFAVIEGE